MHSPRRDSRVNVCVCVGGAVFSPSCKSEQEVIVRTRHETGLLAADLHKAWILAEKKIHK